MEVITYETLREIQRKEKQSEKLVNLEDSFYSSVNEYLKKKAEDSMAHNELRNAKVIFDDIQSRREKKTLYQALRSVRSNEKSNLKEMTSFERDLFQKLVELLKEYHVQIENGSVSEASGNSDDNDESSSSEDAKTEVDEETESSSETEKNDEPEEKDAKEDAKESENEEKSVDSDISKEDDEKGKDYIKVKILEDVPEIVGADLKDYGPFSKGDIVDLPPENAKIFINNGKAEEK